MESTVFERLSALSDSTRARLLLVLERHELTVGELCAVLQLPQSTVSRHLKLLGDDGWVSVRAEGTSRLYAVEARLDAGARKLWHLVREQVTDAPAAAQDHRRLQRIVAERSARSREFFASAAGQWDAVRAELFGVTSLLGGLLALVDPDLTVGDLGCGTGQSAAALAPFVRRVVAIDASKSMLAVARRRLHEHENVETRLGELEALPVADGELDVAMMLLVLHYLPEPDRALAEARRSLRVGGRILLMDMLPHDRAEYRQQMGHAWLGFEGAQLTEWLQGAGFTNVRCTPLPVDAAAKGPALQAVTARAA
ncbi:MAG: hypothetical protein JWO05_53 [Gemmatimonadetes bacterium]|nr:hypothetical protein [Gemmatimonadota bacterium]